MSERFALLKDGVVTNVIVAGDGFTPDAGYILEPFDPERHKRARTIAAPSVAVTSDYVLQRMSAEEKKILRARVREYQALSATEYTDGLSDPEAQTRLGSTISQLIEVGAVFAEGDKVVLESENGQSLLDAMFGLDVFGKVTPEERALIEMQIKQGEERAT